MKPVVSSLLVAALFVLPACGDPEQRLDEHVFHDGPQFRLKVVRYYRNIPFSPLGEQAVVMCRSANTAGYSGDRPQDAGWRVLGSVDVRDSTSARQAVPDVMENYIVRDEHTLIATTRAFNISFDACGHFSSWDPVNLPATMIAPAQQPDSCAPAGPVDCRELAFAGERAPRYAQIRVTGEGEVEFTVRSTAFRDVEMLRIHTRNQGAEWHVDTVGLAGGGQRLVPDTLRTLSVAALEAGQQDVRLVDWLEATLPPRSMVIWPDVSIACGKRPGAVTTVPPAQCAGVRFTDADGNDGALYIAIDTDAEKHPTGAAYYSGGYTSGDRSRPVDSLTGLRAVLDGARQ
jgi:hypothetical protein